MILYCDSSALVKLYIDEVGSDLVREQLAKAEAAALCRIAWVEVHAAFARRVREAPLDAQSVELARAAFVADWPRFVILELNQGLVERAGDYADTFALRAYDSVQLAAAFETAQVSQSPTFFACFDARLNKAAKTLGMSCL
jgi:predicted nucleic acid-binding protein